MIPIPCREDEMAAEALLESSYVQIEYNHPKIRTALNLPGMAVRTITTVNRPQQWIECKASPENKNKKELINMPDAKVNNGSSNHLEMDTAKLHMWPNYYYYIFSRRIASVKKPIMIMKSELPASCLQKTELPTRNLANL